MEKNYPKSPYSMIDTVNNRNNEYFGMYRGTVLDNEDPNGRGRCKVFVYGVYDEGLNKANGRYLPWAEPSQPLFCGGKGDDGANGTFQCPDLSSTVWVFFDSGDIARPVMVRQTTDSNGRSSTEHCTMKWEGMKIDLNRAKSTGTNTISLESKDVISETTLNGNITRSAGDSIVDNAVNEMNLSTENGKISSKSADVTDISAGSDITITATNAKAAEKVNEQAEQLYGELRSREFKTQEEYDKARKEVDKKIEKLKKEAEKAGNIILDANGGIKMTAGHKSIDAVAKEDVVVKAKRIILTADEIYINGKCFINGTTQINGDTDIKGLTTTWQDAIVDGLSVRSHLHSVICPVPGWPVTPPYSF